MTLLQSRVVDVAFGNANRAVYRSAQSSSLCSGRFTGWNQGESSRTFRTSSKFGAGAVVAAGTQAGHTASDVSECLVRLKRYGCKGLESALRFVYLRSRIVCWKTSWEPFLIK